MNKKSLNHLACAALLIASSIGILYWIDCSYYQDQIDQLEKTITALEEEREWEKQSLIEEGEKKWLNGIVRNSLNWIERNYDKQILQIQSLINDLNMEYLQCLSQESLQEIQNISFQVQEQYVDVGIEQYKKWFDYLTESRYNEAIPYFINASSNFKTALSYNLTDEKKAIVIDYLALTYNTLWLTYCQINEYENAYSYYNNSLNIKYDPEVVNDLNSCKEKENNSKKTISDERDNAINTIMSNACTATYWANVTVYPQDTNYCICNNWYSWDEEWTSCIKWSRRENIKRISNYSYAYMYDTDLLWRHNDCHDKYWMYSMAWDYWSCICQRLYTWNSNRTECIALTKSMWDTQCKKTYWNNAIVADDDYERCTCKDWYERNSTQTSCIQKTNCDSYWPQSYLGNDNYCYCKNWYEWNYNKNYCVASRTNSLYGWKDFRDAKDWGDYINMLLDFEDYVSCLKMWMTPINNCKAYNGAKCVCKECENWYELNYGWTSCTSKYNENSSNQEYDENCMRQFGINAKAYDLDYTKCVCKDWFYWNSNQTECIRLTYDLWNQLCKEKFWINSKSNPSNYSNCICEDWYIWNSNYTSCILDTSNQHYSDELMSAYNFAYNNWITTMNNIDDADMYWSLTRIAMAKMISQYTKNILWIYPDISLDCYFHDVSSNLDYMYDNWVTSACQLWLMWQGISDFRPYDLVTRAEFWTILSRALNLNNKAKLEIMNNSLPYYYEHLRYLKGRWIMNNISNPMQKEVRWYVMLMLMRSVE